MATKPTSKVSLPTQAIKSEDLPTMESLREQISRLQVDLESERKQTKLLRREKSYEVQQVRDHEQTKGTVAVKDLRTKLHLEKQKEIETVKEGLGKKYENELSLVTRQREADLTKVRSDLAKCQEELKKTREQICNNKRGLSGLSARTSTFDQSERSRILLQENTELRASKRHLEDEQKRLTDAERSLRSELTRCQAEHKAQTAKTRRETDAEIRRLLEELRAKERHIFQLEKNHGARCARDYSAATQGLLQDTPPGTPPSGGDTSVVTGGNVTGGDQAHTEEYIPTEIGSPPTPPDSGGALCERRVSELTSLITELQRQCGSLCTEKNTLQQKLKEVEEKQRITFEKNKQFLDKNIEVTKINRSLEDKLKSLGKELELLKASTERTQADHDRLMASLGGEDSSTHTVGGLSQEISDMRHRGEDQDKAVQALQIACMEKDRRIDLLVHKRRKRKNSKAQQKMVRFLLPAKCPVGVIGPNGIRETYFGYDEDSLSLDSEMSSSVMSATSSVSAVSLDTSNDDDVFEEIAKDELEQKFQRLTREHLALERTHALLQAQIGNAPADEQCHHGNQDTDLPDMIPKTGDHLGNHSNKQVDTERPKNDGWQEEKKMLAKTIRMLKEKIKNQEQHETRVSFQIQEAQEHNEDLEFRVLELEEANTKLREDSTDTITITEPPTLTNSGVLQMYAEEKGHMEIKLDALREKIQELKQAKDGNLDKGDKLVLLQARAMLGIADKKLKELNSEQNVFKERIKKLEAQKAELLADATGVSADLVLEHEDTRHRLEDAEQRIIELEALLLDHKKQEAVHKYTEKHSSETEARQREEIAALQRRLRSSTEGREFERELWQEHHDRVRELERDGVELQGRIASLCQNVSELELDNAELERDKAELEARLGEAKGADFSVLQTKLEETSTEVATLTSRLAEADEVAAEMTERYSTLEDTLAETSRDLDGRTRRVSELEAQVHKLSEAQTSAEATAAHPETTATRPDTATRPETADQATETDVTEVEEVLKTLQDKHEKLQKLAIDRKNRAEENVKKAKELEVSNKSLTEEVSGLQSSNEELQSSKEELQSTNEELQSSVQSLKSEVDTAHTAQQEAETKITQLNTQSQTLLEKVRVLELRVREARDQDVAARDALVLMEEEKTRRIEALQTQVDKMEENEQRLSDTISDMEQVEAELRSQSGQEAELKAKIDQLEAQLKDQQDFKTKMADMAQKESQLLEQLNSMKLENQKLQEHMDKSQVSETTGEELQQLREEVKQLETEKENIKEQLIKAKLSATGQDERISELEQSESKISRDLEEKEKDNVYLREKVDLLKKSEDKLMEQIGFLEENRQKLNEEIFRLREAQSTSSIDSCADNKLETQRIKALETREKELTETVKELEKLNSTLKDTLSKYQKDQSDELRDLKEKLDILLDTEEKLVDKIDDLEKSEANSKSKLEAEKKKVEEFKNQLEVLKAKSEQLKDEKSQLVDNEKSKLKELEDKEKVMKVQFRDLEKSEGILKVRVTGLGEQLKQKDQIENGLRQKLSSAREAEDELTARLNQMEKNEIALRGKLKSLETQKQELLDTIKTSAQKTQPKESKEPSPKPTSSQKPTTAASQLKSRTLEELSSMPREEMISRIHELEQMEEFHMKKIRELSENLSSFRQAVEVVAVTMETDADVPVLKSRPRIRDKEIEAKVQELVKSEVLLKLRNLDLEKKEAILKCQLRERETTLKQQTKEYRSEIEDLEGELDHVRKSEARLKNKLQYGSWGQETAALAKIQHLENLVFDLEMSERQLKRRLQEAEDNTREARDTLHQHMALSEPWTDSLKKLEKQDRYYELLTRVTLDDGSHDNQRLRDLARSEVSLKQQLDALEAQEATVDFEEEASPLVLDSPEAIHRQRIRELEKMERHLKQQIVELEKDREELHDITRKDKSLIHDLNVQVRQLQLTEKTLREQITRLEAAESALAEKLDDTNEKLEELEDKIKKHQATERQLRANQQKFEYQEGVLTAQLEHAREDMKKMEGRIKRNSADMDFERQKLVSQGDEMTNRVGDLEGVEMNLRQKIRSLEKSEADLKEKIHTVQQSEKNAIQRTEELENINETLSQRIHKLEEDKSALVFEMSELEMEKAGHGDNVNKIKKDLSSYIAALEEHRSLLKASSEKEARLQARLTEREKEERSARDEVTRLQQEVVRLRGAMQHSNNNKDSQNQELEHELKKQLNKYNSTTQDTEGLQKALSTTRKAHELLKRNHEELKRDMKQIHKQISSGSVTVDDKPLMFSKSVQVRLADSYSIRHLAPADLLFYLEEKEEFKNALRSLGARHPEAYHDFLRALQPTDNKQLSLVTVSAAGDQSPASPNKDRAPPTPVVAAATTKESKPLRTPMKMSDSGINEDFILAQTPDGTDGSKPEGSTPKAEGLTPKPGTVSVQHPSRGSSMFTIHSSRHKHKPVSEDVIAPRNKVADHTHDQPAEPDETTRRALIGQLVDTLPTNDVASQSTEAPLWHVVETESLDNKEKPFWNKIEGGAPIDDMTVTLDVWGVTTTDESSSEASGHPGNRSLRPGVTMATSSADSSEMSAPPPPLPSSLPPVQAPHPDTDNESYYLPGAHSQTHDDDSENDVSDIEPDHPTATARAKSADRDSDFSEGSYLSRASSAGRGHRGRGKLRLSLESIADSGTGSLRQDEVIRGLRTRVSQLEAQAKAKPGSAEDSKDMLKDCDCQQRMESSLSPSFDRKVSADNTRIKRDLEDKERTIRLLKQEVDNLEKLNKAKDILASNSQLLLKETSECNRLKDLLERKEKELKVKTSEIERLHTDLHRWQSSVLNTDKPASTRTGTDGSTYDKIQQAYNTLRTENASLRSRVEELAPVTEQKSALETVVRDLKVKVTECERIELERRDLERKVKALEEELRSKAKSESDLTQESVRIRHDIDALRTDHKHYQLMERDYIIIRAKFSEMEQMKSKALTMITPLRSKVLRLAGRCKSKDELIGRLAADLRRQGAHSTGLVEADKLATHAGSEEYNRPISPVTASNLNALETELRSSELAMPLSLQTVKPSRIPRRLDPARPVSNSSSSSDLDQLDTGAVTNGNTNPRRAHSANDILDDLISHVNNNGKISIDDIVAPPPQLTQKPVDTNSYKTPAATRATNKSPGVTKNGSGPCEVYRAIKKYDPKYFSTSGHQGLELALNEGDIVKVYGGQDHRGYYEAEVDGHHGLVPSLYLQPLNTSHSLNSRRTTGRQLCITEPSQRVTSPASPEPLLSLQSSPVPNPAVACTSPTSASSVARRPTNQVTSHSPFLAHPAYAPRAPVPTSPRGQQPASVRHPAYSGHHGSTPHAFKRRLLPLPKLIINSFKSASHRGSKSGSRTRPQSPRSGAQSPPPVDRVQPYCRATPLLGPPDAPSDLCIQRVVGDHSLLLSWTPPVMDELARSNGSVVKGYKITINGRDKQSVPSPHMTKALLEHLDLSRTLALRIQTAGEGALVSNAVELICDDLTRQRRSDDTDMSLLSAPSGDECQRKVFLAVYDYRPEESSPHADYSQELAFRTGDIIVTTGGARTDGFYHGKVHGKRGLVPASFVEEIAMLHSRGRRSVCSSMSLPSSLFSGASTPLERQSRPPSSQSGHSSRLPTAIV